MQTFQFPSRFPALYFAPKTSCFLIPSKLKHHLDLCCQTSIWELIYLNLIALFLFLIHRYRNKFFDLGSIWLLSGSLSQKLSL